MTLNDGVERCLILSDVGIAAGGSGDGRFVLNRPAPVEGVDAIGAAVGRLGRRGGGAIMIPADAFRPASRAPRWRRRPAGRPGLSRRADRGAPRRHGRRAAIAVSKEAD